jgi:hypothetical protein
MDVETYRCNVSFLEERQAQYPHRCRTKTGYPRPEAVKINLPGLEFIRAPLGPTAEWGFETKEGMIRFKQHYITEDNRK